MSASTATPEAPTTPRQPKYRIAFPEQISLYRQLKRNFPKELILLKRGDFYEAFDEDAITLAPILGIPLTKTNQTPTCGFPHQDRAAHAIKLQKAGKPCAFIKHTFAPQAPKSPQKKEHK